MESRAGSALSPVIKIINNTNEELNNVVLSLEDIDDSSIEISSLTTNSEVITTLNTSLIKDSTNLILSYDHENIHEKKVVYPKLKPNYIIRLTLEISEVDGEHNIVSIIEKDPVDNPIELIKTERKSSHKIMLITGIATLSALFVYNIYKKNNK